MQFISSLKVVELLSKEAVDAWLAIEPYVTGKVWEHIEVIPCKVGPSFVSPIST